MFLFNNMKCSVLVSGIFVTDILLALSGNVAKYPLFCYVLYGLSLIFIYVLVFSVKEEHSRGTVISSFPFVVVSGIILRLIFMNYQLSDDVNRYAFEGMIINQGLNPYIVAPDRLQEHYPEDKILAGVNHQNVQTAYPPVALFVFSLLSAYDYSLGTYKVFFIVLDCMILLLLVKLLKYHKKNGNWLVLYAWNPLILIYGAGEGHFDLLHLFFIICSLILFKVCEGKKTAVLIISLAYFTLGLAVMTKFLSCLLLPFLITKKNYRFLPVFFIPFFSYAFFWEQGMFQGLLLFSGKMAYNDFFPKVLRWLFGRSVIYSFAMLLLFAAGFLLIWLVCQKDRHRGMLLSYFWCLLCLPCVHIWYLMLLVILFMLYPLKAGYLFFLTIGSGFYVASHQYYGGEWQENNLVWLITYLPVIYLFVKGLVAGNDRVHFQKNHFPVQTCDVIIPVFDDDVQLNMLLSSLHKTVEHLKQSYADLHVQIYVVEGGGKKNSLRTAARFGTSYISTDKISRGGQINTGFMAGHGDIALILHADSQIDATRFIEFISKLKENKQICWGILGHCYDKQNIKLRILEILNNLRFSIAGIAFGDQGIFFRRSIIDDEVKLPNIPLMEDLEISLRLSGLPKLNVGRTLTASSRRWGEKKYYRKVFSILSFIFYYLFGRKMGVDIKLLSRKLYVKYYGGE